MQNKNITALLVIAMVVGSAIPLTGAESASSSVTVNNVYPKFVEFRMSDNGGSTWSDWISYHWDPSTYTVSCGSVYQNGHFEDLWIGGTATDTKYDPDTEAVILPDPTEYRVVLNPGASPKDINVEVKIQDSNGDDDIEGAQISMLIDSKGTFIGPGPMGLSYNRTEGVDKAVYAGTFMLYPTTPNGEWRISLKFRDTTMYNNGITPPPEWPSANGNWYYTHSAQFYVGAYISINVVESTIDFGGLDPGAYSSEHDTDVKNTGNVPVDVSISPGLMAGTGGSLSPWNSGATNSDGFPGTPGLEGSPDGSLELGAMNTWIPPPAYPTGNAGFEVHPQTGTPWGSYGGSIIFTATAT